MIELEHAIIKTLAWFDIFNHPMTEWEIFKFLYAPNLDPKKCDFIKVKSCLQNPSPWLQTHIEKHDARYTLPDKKWLIQRHERQHIRFRKKWQRAKIMAKQISMIPFLKTFAMCNVFTLQDSNSLSDMDVFIIAQKNRIWIVRSLTTALTFILKKWRHKKYVSNRFCLSFFITNEELDLKSIIQKPYDIYLIYWIALLAPLYGKQEAEKFFTSNTWISKYLPNWYHRDESDKYTTNSTFFKKTIKHLFQVILNGKLGNLTEHLAKYLQLRHMSHHTTNPKSSIIISDTMLKFHNEDRRKNFRSTWERKVKAILNK